MSEAEINLNCLRCDGLPDEDKDNYGHARVHTHVSTRMQVKSAAKLGSLPLGQRPILC